MVLVVVCMGRAKEEYPCQNVDQAQTFPKDEAERHRRRVVSQNLVKSVFEFQQRRLLVSFCRVGVRDLVHLFPQRAVVLCPFSLQVSQGGVL